MNSLPTDIIYNYIFSYLDHSTIISLTQVSRRYNNLNWEIIYKNYDDTNNVFQYVVNSEFKFLFLMLRRDTCSCCLIRSSNLECSSFYPYAYFCSYCMYNDSFYGIIDTDSAVRRFGKRNIIDKRYIIQYGYTKYHLLRDLNCKISNLNLVKKKVLLDALSTVGFSKNDKRIVSFISYIIDVKSNCDNIISKIIEVICKLQFMSNLVDENRNNLPTILTFDLSDNVVSRIIDLVDKNLKFVLTKRKNNRNSIFLENIEGLLPEINRTDLTAIRNWDYIDRNVIHIPSNIDIWSTMTEWKCEYVPLVWDLYFIPIDKLKKIHKEMMLNSLHNLTKHKDVCGIVKNILSNI